jgi:hypothetical protein
MNSAIALMTSHITTGTVQCSDLAVSNHELCHCTDGVTHHHRYGTMFGSADGTVYNQDAAMPAALLVDRWVSAFAQDGSGCPRV